MDRENIIINNIKSIADAIAKHNGDNCEVCVHDLKAEDVDHTIIYIVNNHVTGRKVGDSFSFNYLKSRKLLEEGKDLTNRLVFHNQTLDGKYLKCSTLYLKDYFEFKKNTGNGTLSGYEHAAYAGVIGTIDSLAIY